MIAERMIPATMARDINEIFSVQYPMFPGFVRKMIEKGVYVVVDDLGKRLPTEKAVELL